MLERIKNLVYPVLSNKDVVINENTVILKDLDINSYDIVESWYASDFHNFCF